MKGMKKPLALLLALVMAFSLLSVGAWADLIEVPEEEPAQIDEALPETPAEEPAEAPEEEAAPAEDPAEAPENEAVLFGEGDESAGGAVAKIGDAEYATLPAAVEAAQDGDTITLLRDATGYGVKVVAAKPHKVTIDFDGHTYTVNRLVGSTGYESQAFHIEKGSEFTLKNGAIRSVIAPMIIQNYCALTLENMDLDLSGASNVTYVVSNNFGSLTVTGNTVIKAASGRCAFDLWYGLNKNGLYDDGVTVTFDDKFTGTVSGIIEYGREARAASFTDWMDKTELNINSPKGTFDVTFASSTVGVSAMPEGANINITGGMFSKKNATPYLAEGYLQLDDGRVVKNETDTATDDSVVEVTKGAKKSYLVTFPTTLDAGTYKLLKALTLGDKSVQVSGDVTLDLNGNNVTSGVPSAKGAFQVQVDGSNFTIQNSGTAEATISAPTGRVVKIGADNKFDGHNITVTVKSGVILDADADGAVAIYGEDSAGGVVAKANASQIKNANNKFTLEPGAKITGDEGFGIGLFGTGNEVHIYGSIETGSYAVSSNGNDRFASTFTNSWSWTYNCSINVYEGASIKTPATADIPAVYLPGSNLFNMTGGSIEGYSAIYNKATTVNISGGELKGTGAYKDYTSTSNGAVSTGDALVMDSEGATYAMGTPKAIIAGDVVISSVNASAVGSYAKANATNLDGSKTARVTGFIGVGVKLSGAKDTNADLLAANCSIGDDGVVKETVTKTENVQSVSIEVSTPASTNAAADGNAAQGSVDLSAITLETALAGETLQAGDKVEFSMSAVEKAASDSANSVVLEIHPVYQVTHSDSTKGGEGTVPSTAINEKMTVKLPGILTGKIFKALWHKVDDNWEDATNLVLFSADDLIFQTKSFSEWKVEYEGNKENATGELTLTLSSDGTTTAVPTTLAELTTEYEIPVKVTSDKTVTLSAYDITVVIPKTLTVVETTIPHSNTVATPTDGSDNTLRFITYGQDGKYVDLTANQPTTLGVIKVHANAANAVYNDDIKVEIKDGDLGVTSRAGSIKVANTEAHLKLTKQWTITFANLYDTNGVTVKTDSKTVGHNVDIAYADPTRTGATFNGWTASKGADKSTLASGTKATADVTYTAKWNLTEYTITFEDSHTDYQDFDISAIKATPLSGSAKTVTDKKLTYTIEDTITGNATKTAYTFVNWGVPKKTTDADTVGATWGTTALAAFGDTGKNGYYGNVTLKADWTADTYTITWGTEDVTDPATDYTAIRGKSADTVPTTTVEYTIESGITGAPKKDGYDFIGWKASGLGNPNGGSNGNSWDTSKEYATNETFKGYYGAVKLTPVWKVALEYKFLNFNLAYAANSDTAEKLMLVKWKAGDSQKLTFTTDTVDRTLYETTETNYTKEFESYAEGEACYVTIVPNAEILASAGDTTQRKFAITSGATNDAVEFNGDVINADGTTALDKKISLADLSNANDLVASQSLFNNSEISILGRLHADITKDHDGRIDDLAQIMGLIGTDYNAS